MSTVNDRAMETSIITGVPDDLKAVLIVENNDTHETYSVNVVYGLWSDETRKVEQNDDKEAEVREIVGDEIYNWIVDGCDPADADDLPPLTVYPRDVAGLASIYPTANYTIARKLTAADKRVLIKRGPWRVRAIEDFAGAARLQLFIDVDGEPVKVSLLLNDEGDNLTLKYSNKALDALVDSLDQLPAKVQDKVRTHYNTQLAAARNARARDLQEQTGLPFADVIIDGVSYDFKWEPSAGETVADKPDDAVIAYVDVLQVRDFNGTLYAVGQVSEVNL